LHVRIAYLHISKMSQIVKTFQYNENKYSLLISQDMLLYTLIGGQYKKKWGVKNETQPIRYKTTRLILIIILMNYD
jgi:hypothetical protein